MGNRDARPAKGFRYVLAAVLLLGVLTCIPGIYNDASCPKQRYSNDLGYF